MVVGSDPCKNSILTGLKEGERDIHIIHRAADEGKNKGRRENDIGFRAFLGLRQECPPT